MKRAAALALLLALSGCGGDTLSGDLLLRADRVFDGREFIEGGAVLIEGDEIVAVGNVDAEAKRTIELGDATILPGIIDLHVHVEEQMLEGGVTTVRNVGAPLSDLQRPDRYAPLRIIDAGPLMSVPGGYPGPVHGPELALEVLGPADARRAVRDLVSRGAEVIKISLEPGFGWPMLSTAEARAIVDEAHAAGLRVTAHVGGRGGTVRAVEAGVDDLAHLPCGGVGDEILQFVRDAEIEIVATLHVITIYSDCEPLVEARRFVALGGSLLYGTDVGNPGIPLGIDVAELRLLQDAGLSPAEVLAAATSRAGEQLGLEPLGTLADGAPADVIAVPGDAGRLDDDVAVPLLVIAGGRIVRESLR